VTVKSKLEELGHYSEQNTSVFTFKCKRCGYIFAQDLIVGTHCAAMKSKVRKVIGPGIGL